MFVFVASGVAVYVEVEVEVVAWGLDGMLLVVFL